jgi:glycosyltransferase involved in cell wall biosynthesis
MSNTPQLPPILGTPQSNTSPRIKKPLHVLTLTPFYPSANDDVFGCFIAEQVEALAQAGVVNTVFAMQPFYRKKVRPRSGGVEAQWLRYFSLPGGIGLPTAGAFVFGRIVSLVREMQRSHRIDLIHAHAPLPCGHAAMLLSHELGLPYVVSVHGLDAYATTQVRGRAGQWCRRICQRVYRQSKRVICVSEKVREQVLEGSDGGCRTSVVYNGVDPEMFSPGSDSSVRKHSVLSVGNLIPIKGHDVLIRAIASLSPEFPELTLEIIGSGEELSRLQALAGERGIADRVRFPGRQSRDRIAEAMRRCSVFALPSRYEGLGCVYLEAMSTGKPVIGCRGQGIAEIIQHGANGFLVGADNDRELALAIAMLLRDDRLRARLGVSARDTILDRLTLSHQTETLSRIYRESAA